MIEADPNSIQPSQDFLKQRTVQYILRCIAENDLSELPPEPIVRRDENGQLVAIDGHNLLAVRAFLGENQVVHIAESASDGLPTDNQANVARNQDLADKFTTCLIERDRVVGNGIVSFQNLIEQYPELFS